MLLFQDCSEQVLYRSNAFGWGFNALNSGKVAVLMYLLPN
jgi:hypothetical protein